MSVPFADPTIVLFGKLTLAVVLGSLIGAERLAAGKGAGMRTFALVSLGACLFIIVGIEGSNAYLGYVNFDPTRMLAGVVQGIGFLGAGLIIFRGDHVQGLTTAVGLWIAGAIGSTVGFGLYELALFTTVLTLFVFTGLWYCEEKLRMFFVRFLGTPDHSQP